MRRALAMLALVAAVVAMTVSAGARKPHSRAYTASIGYTETNHGRDGSDGSVKGIEVKGKFSAKFGPGAAIAARVIGAATGVPFADIAKGGTYRARRDIDKNGKVTALLVARFKAPGLGTACLSLVAKPGKFNGGSFIPTSGTLKMVGGKGAAARWRGSAGFDQTDLTGSSGAEQLKEKGAAHASTGAKKGLTKACKSVAKQRG
jgi:hypothetical protein